MIKTLPICSPNQFGSNCGRCRKLLIELSVKSCFRLYYDILTIITVCPPNQFGPNCAKCRKRCRSCDPITGECIQCDGLYYGEYCQHNCPDNCLNMTCDQRTGYCNSCVDGYKGNTCEQYTGMLLQINVDK